MRHFQSQAAYVVMCVSRAYVEKAWPRHERRSALSRMIEDKREYVLPVRFDDTQVPGLPERRDFPLCQSNNPCRAFSDGRRKTRS